MRSLNAAGALGGRIARPRDCSRLAFALAALCGIAAVAACSGGQAPTITSLPSSDAKATPPVVLPVRPRPAAPALLPADLAGLGAAEVAALLGAPDFRRSERPVELWQYRNADCILDVFLYENARGYHVVHAETRQRRQLVATGGGCSDGAASFVRRGRQNRL